MPKEQNNLWKEKELGLLWRKQGKNGDYLSGFIKNKKTGEETRILIFSKKKFDDTAPNAPDYVIFDNSDSQAGQKSSFPSSSKAKAPVEEEVPESNGGDNVPF
jgi:hypothetical protein